MKSIHEHMLEKGFFCLPTSSCFRPFTMLGCASSPRLPVELEREIFELSASVCDSKGVSLTLVARRVQAWIEPLVYETLVLDSRKESQRILDLANERPLGFLASIVRKVVLTNATYEPHSILSLCSGATHVAMDEVACSDLLIPPVLASMTSIRHLTIAAGEMPECTLGLIYSPAPVFRGVTHLTLLDYFHFEGDLLPFVASLPALTHLALYHPPLCQTTRRFLEVCTNLHVLVILADSEEDRLRKMAGNTSISDTTRVAICVCKGWADGVTVPEGDPENYWTAAEQIIRRLGRDPYTYEITFILLLGSR
ncbi:hypothetical protein MIND_01156200 [Mycena indigotica]|uniref:Uncharacterized protein n=1 Tax=Mycena indigotica TaxID=2126181 RepID=A0A8H6S694_9AGAR|nr:uncharacterized protein MIND_01156200 [Mycena indigotica]KAF7292587.1 hypothetical protein MIND_01156200 [Mycena indigotica]